MSLVNSKAAKLLLVTRFPPLCRLCVSRCPVTCGFADDLTCRVACPVGPALTCTLCLSRRVGEGGGVEKVRGGGEPEEKPKNKDRYL